MRLTLLACLTLLAAAASLYPGIPSAAHVHATQGGATPRARYHAARHGYHANLIGVALHSHPAEALSFSPPTREKKYVCPPCGCGSDGREFDKPGTCPSCEMELVERGPDAAAAATAEAQSVVVKAAYAVEPPPSQNVTAGYMIVENQDAAEIALVSAASESAEAVELHTMETEGGMMRMRRVERIGVPAKGSVELKPGGLHLMFIDFRREIKDGEELTVTLHFSNSTKKIVSMPVRKRPAA